MNRSVRSAGLKRSQICQTSGREVDPTAFNRRAVDPTRLLVRQQSKYVGCSVKYMPLLTPQSESELCHSRVPAPVHL